MWGDGRDDGGVAILRFVPLGWNGDGDDLISGEFWNFGNYRNPIVPFMARMDP